MIRTAVVAGKFYPANKSALDREVRSRLTQEADKIDALGCVMPHAGYMYSGRVAGSVISSIKPKKVYVVLGTKHTWLGARFGVDVARSWETPLGEVPVDAALGREIINSSELFEADSLCHDEEHSIEVELPFFQVVSPLCMIVPIIISQGTIDEYKRAAAGIAGAVRASKKDVLIVASSDMTHYEPQAEARKKDKMVLDAILRLDMPEMIRTVEEYSVSMCGFAPAAVMIETVRALGASNAKLVKYETSAEASGDFEEVVGYAGVVIY